MATTRYLIFGASYNGDGSSSSEASGVGGTVGALFTLATQGKVNWTAHGLAENTIVYFIGSGVLPTGITAGTTYYVRNPGTNNFEISTTSGGSSIALSGSPTGNARCSTQGAWSIYDNVGGSGISYPHIDTGFSPSQGGALAAGDIINIRSLTGAGWSGGADQPISVALGGSITLGSSSATATAPITWILDDGTIWSGKN